MDERAVEIVNEIEEDRERLGDDLAHLERRVRQRTDWRTYFAKRPWTVLGIAVVGGFLLSALTSWRSR